MNVSCHREQSFLNIGCWVLDLGLDYGVATISRMLKNTGLFAEYRSLL